MKNIVNRFSSKKLKKIDNNDKIKIFNYMFNLLKKNENKFILLKYFFSLREYDLYHRILDYYHNFFPKNLNKNEHEIFVQKMYNYFIEYINLIYESIIPIRERIKILKKHKIYCLIKNILKTFSTFLLKNGCDKSYFWNIEIYTKHQKGKYKSDFLKFINTDFDYYPDFNNF